MEIDLYKVFLSSPTLVVFVAIALGYLVGKINIKGFELGATGGVLIVALVFGDAGFEPHPILGTIGFTLFIYSVGLQAGPRFFNVLLEDGPRYIALAVVVALTGYGLAKVLALGFGLDNGLAAGILAGALTSTPTLVGAQNAISAGIAVAPPGVAPDQLVENITVGYAMTYVFGTVGIILLIKLLPVMLKIDLVKLARQYARQKGYKESDKVVVTGLPVVRGYQINEEGFAGKTRREIEVGTENHVGILRIKRGREIIDLDLDDVLEAGDKVAVLAPPDRHAVIREYPELTPGILDQDLLDSYITNVDIVVVRDDAVGRALRELRVLEDFGCYVTRIKRAQIELPAAGDTVLQKADVMTVAGDSQELEALARKIGQIEREIQETDLVTFALGISLGLFIGQIQIKLGNIDIGLGSAGGLLVAGILLGYLRSIHPTFGRVPPAARYIIMELGLMLFMVNVGITAGGGIVEALLSVGPVVILSGILVLLAPIIVGYLFGTFVLKLNPALLLGSLTGALTSTPALAAVQQAAKSSMPALGYAGTYAFANVLLTIAGTLMMLF